MLDLSMVGIHRSMSARVKVSDCCRASAHTSVRTAVGLMPCFRKNISAVFSVIVVTLPVVVSDYKITAFFPIMRLFSPFFALPMAK